MQPDVLIVGGGIAGATLGLVLARAGRTVTLAEREATFRDRIRGDSMFPWGAVLAAELGIHELLIPGGARPLPTWQMYEDRAPSESYVWGQDIPTPDLLWGVDLPRLQETLLDAAVSAGVTLLRPARAVSVEPGNPPAVAVEQDGVHRRCTPRLVVAADGRESGVRRAIGANTTHAPVHHMLGGCLVSGVALDADTGHLGRITGGKVMVFRHAGDSARLYLVCAPEAAQALRPGGFEAYRAHCALAFPEGALSSAAALGPVAFFPGIDVYPDRLVAEGVVLIGDAAGANDPALGSGTGLALLDVQALAKHLLENDDWQDATETFARDRRTWYDPMRAFGEWTGPLDTDTGPAADAARARAERAKEADRWRNGYGAFFAFGPRGLPVSDEARAHFLGLDLPELA
ncbi:MAG: FAD-dependent monooxygenase [Thermomicrobiales bacterium]|nr:FAD-dependent monooxygenase [Thermomicrobiales bacterium]